ncbi:MAG: contractile injection system tape measure protein, partial [Bacteroidota bacterium]
MSSLHHIKKVRVSVGDVGSASEEVTKQFYLTQQGLKEELEQVFDEYFPGEERVHIPKITIDLGKLPFENYSQVYKERVIVLIKEELEKYRQRSQPELTQDLHFQVEELHFEALRHFLVSGYIENSSAAKSFDLVQEFERLLADSPKLKALLRDIWSNEGVQVRLQRQLPDDLFRKTEDLMSFQGRYRLSPQVITLMLLKYLREGNSFQVVEEKSLHYVLPLEFSSLFASLDEAGIQRVAEEVILLLGKEAVRTRMAKSLSFLHLKKLFSSINRFKNALDLLDKIKEQGARQSRTGPGYFESIEWKVFWLHYLSVTTQPDRQRKVLRRFLQRFLSESTYQAIITEIAREDSGLAKALIEMDRSVKVLDRDGMEAFPYFLETGVWASKEPFDEVVRLLLSLDSATLKGALGPLMHHYHVRKRLAEQLRPDQLEKVLNGLVTSQGYATWFEEAISQMEKRSKGRWRKRTTIYQAGLEVFFATPHASLRKDEFFDQLAFELIQLLPEMDATSQTLHRRFDAAAVSKGNVWDQLLEALPSLDAPSGKEARSRFWWEELVGFTLHSSDELVQLLVSYFRTGTFSEWPAPVEDQVIQRLIQWGIVRKEPLVVQVFDQIRFNSDAMDRFIDFFDEESPERWVEMTDAGTKRELTPIIYFLMQFWNQSPKLLPTLSTSELWIFYLKISSSGNILSFFDLVKQLLVRLYEDKRPPVDAWYELMKIAWLTFNNTSVVQKAIIEVLLETIQQEEAHSIPELQAASMDVAGFEHLMTLQAESELSKWVDRTSATMKQAITPFLDVLVHHWNERPSLAHALSISELWTFYLNVSFSGNDLPLSATVQQILTHLYNEKKPDVGLWQEVLRGVQSTLTNDELLKGVSEAVLETQKKSTIPSTQTKKSDVWDGYAANEAVKSLMVDGVGSSYYHLLSDPTERSQVFQVGTILFDEVKNLVIHDSFWSQVLPQLDVETIGSFIKKLLPNHTQVLTAVLDEVERLNATLPLKQRFPEMGKEGMIGLLKKYITRYGIISAKEFYVVAFEEQLVSKFNSQEAARFKTDLAGLLLLKATRRRRFPLLAGWLLTHQMTAISQEEALVGRVVAYLNSTSGEDRMERVQDFRELIAVKKDGTVPLLISILGRKVYAPRFIALLEPDTIPVMVQNLEPNHAKTLLTLFESLNLSEVSRKFHISDQKAREVWLGALLKVSYEGSFSSPEEAVTVYFDQIASQLQWTTRRLFTLLMKDGLLGREVLPEKLNPKLKEPDSWEVREIVDAQKDQYTVSDLILHYLKTGNIAEWSTLKDSASFGKYLEEGIRQHSQVFKEAVSDLPEKLNPGAALQKLLGQGVLSDFLKQEAREAFGQMEALFTELSTLLKTTLSGPVMQKQEIAFFDHWLEIRKKSGGLSLETSRLIHSLLSVLDSVEDQLIKEMKDQESWEAYPLLTQFLRAKASRQAGGVVPEQAKAFALKDLVRFYLHTQEFPVWSTVKSEDALNMLLDDEGVQGTVVIFELLQEMHEQPSLMLRLAKTIKDELIFEALRKQSQRRFQSYVQVYEDLVQVLDGTEEAKKRLVSWFSVTVIDSKKTEPLGVIESLVEKLKVRKDVLTEKLMVRQSVLKSEQLLAYLEDEQAKKEIEAATDGDGAGDSNKESVSKPIGKEVVDAFQHVLLYEALPWW